MRTAAVLAGVLGLALGAHAQVPNFTPFLQNLFDGKAQLTQEQADTVAGEIGVLPAAAVPPPPLGLRASRAGVEGLPRYHDFAQGVWNMTEFVRLDGPTIDQKLLAAVKGGSSDYRGAAGGG